MLQILHCSKYIFFITDVTHSWASAGPNCIIRRLCHSPTHRKSLKKNNIHLFIYRNFFVILGNRQGQALLATSFHITAWQGFQAYRSIVGNLLAFHVDPVVFVDCFPPHNCNEKKSMSLLVAVTSSGILKAKQKLGVTFNFDKQESARRHWFNEIFKNDNVQGLRSKFRKIVVDPLFFGQRIIKGCFFISKLKEI